MPSVVVIPSNLSKSVYVGGASKISVYVSSNSGSFDSHTRIVNQPGHGFVAGNIVAKRDTGYVKSSLATLTNWGFYLVVAANQNEFTIATAPGLHSIPNHGWGSAGTLLFHSQTDGIVSAVAPVSGQFVAPIASVFDANTVYVQPNLFIQRLV